MSAAAIRVVVDADGATGFLDQRSGVFITNPFLSTCGRFDIDPEREYGVDVETARRVVAANEALEERQRLPS